MRITSSLIRKYFIAKPAVVRLNVLMNSLVTYQIRALYKYFLAIFTLVFWAFVD